MSNIHICSFHDASGKAEHEGKTYRWDFSVLFGPLFMGEDGNPLNKQPGPRTTAWRLFERWYEEVKIAQKVCK